MSWKSIFSTKNKRIFPNMYLAFGWNMLQLMKLHLGITRVWELLKELKKIYEIIFFVSRVRNSLTELTSRPKILNDSSKGISLWQCQCVLPLWKAEHLTVCLWPSHWQGQSVLHILVWTLTSLTWTTSLSKIVSVLDMETGFYASETDCKCRT